MLPNIDKFVKHRVRHGDRITHYKKDVPLDLKKYNKKVDFSVPVNSKPRNNHEYNLWLCSPQRYDFTDTNWFLLATTNLFDLPYTKVHKCYWPFKLKSDIIRKSWGQNRWLTWRKDLFNSYVISLTHSNTKMEYNKTIRYRLNKRNLPRTFGLSKLLSIKGSPDLEVRYIRCFLSLLKDYEVEKAPINYDVSSITNLWKGDLSWFPVDVVDRSLGYSRFTPPVIENEDFWFDSPSGGPNGSPSWQFWWKDSIALFPDPNTVIRNNLRYFAQLYKLEFDEHLEHIARLGLGCNDFAKDNSAYHSRLMFLQDKAGKTRCVALVDLYTQSCLKPIHRFFASQNRDNPCDFTSDQDLGRSTVLKNAIKGGTMYSFDLKNATDTLPSKLVEIVCTPILGAETCSRWISLMTDREFSYKQVVKEWDKEKSKWSKTIVEKTARYGTGIPMGLLSCFPGALAYTHHCIVQASAFEAGLKLPYRNYVMLGDDIVIFDEAVGLTYEKVINRLGMVISRHKSIVGKSSAEFAKTLISRARLITPLPWLLIDKSRLYPGFLLQLLKDLKLRYALAEVKLNSLVNLLPVSKREEGLILLTCYAVTKVRVSDRIKPLLFNLDTKEYIWYPKENSPLTLFLTHWNDPSFEMKEKMNYMLRLRSFRDFFKDKNTLQDILSTITNNRYYPWVTEKNNKKKIAIKPFSPIYHRFRKINSLIVKTFKNNQNPSNCLLSLLGNVSELGYEDRELSDILDKTLIGYTLSQSFTKPKGRSRKFTKNEDVYRKVGQSIVKLFWALKFKKKNRILAKGKKYKGVARMCDRLVIPNGISVSLLNK